MIIKGVHNMRNRLSLVVTMSVLLLFVACSGRSMAALEAQRKDFLAAEEALESGDLQRYNQLLAGLRDYPLYPYLVYRQIKKDITLDQEDRVLWFLEEYGSTPPAVSLRQEWLDLLADSGQWQKLIRDFQGPASQALQCSYAKALMETGQTSRAMEMAEKLWLHGGSRPEECDPVFRKWREKGGLTPDLTWQRAEMAIDQGQINLARYLRRYLPREEQPWLDLWLEVISRPSKTLEISWQDKQHPAAEKIFIQGMGGLIREDTVKALSRWQEFVSSQDFGHMDITRVRQDLAFYLALRRHPEAMEYFEELCSDLMTPSLREWQVRNALYRKDWTSALTALDRMDESQKQSLRWTYWRGRVFEELGLKHEANALYQSILGGQDYFSLLAADRLGQAYHIEHRSISSPVPDITGLTREPGIARALELFHLDRPLEGRREWNLALAGRSAGDFRSAALLAHDRGWHDRAIVAAANAMELDDLIVRFPMSYADLISGYSEDRGLDPAWVYAVARQESMFMADAGSSAGAMGIMQIMPATGRMIASETGENFSSREVLLNPEINVRFGTFYLKKRLDELQDNPVLATAAYNAGAHRVRSWLPEDGTMASDIWVENIPFFETRNYVEKVFTYKVIYETRLGFNPSRVSGFMPEIKGKSTFLAEEKSN
jgi:soluble lytic murein transglycosylase